MGQCNFLCEVKVRKQQNFKIIIIYLFVFNITQVGFNSDSRVKVWRATNERYNSDCVVSKSSNRQSVMFWGLITIHGVGLLQVCPSPMNHKDYIDIIEQAAIQESGHFGYKFMDDNAPIHRAGAVINWKNDNSVISEDWPPRSPDLNPIENIWAIIKNKLNKLENKPKTISELILSFGEFWYSMPNSHVKNLYSSLPNRLQK